MALPEDQPDRISVTRAFVVQFQADTVVEQGHLAGRVEHVVSGQATDFTSLETLLAFMAQVLRTERAHPTEPRGCSGFESRHHRHAEDDA
jgi:hypothetical protein